VYHSETWSASNLVQNFSFFQVDNYENGHGDPFVMLGHVNADVNPNEPKLVDISFVNVRIHNNGATCNVTRELIFGVTFCLTFAWTWHSVELPGAGCFPAGAAGA